MRVALVAGGMMSAFGMFNALVLSYSRLPYAMAQDGMLPAAFAKLTRRTGVPWASVVVLATAWALCLGLGFRAAGDDRHPDLRLESAAGIRSAGGAALYPA